MAKCLAKWGEKVFEVSPNKIVPMHKLSTKFARKSDANKDTSGTAATNTRGLELQQITLETTYLAGVGVDPRKELESWQGQFGKHYPLHIGGEIFGPSLLELDSISFPSIITDNKGTFLQVDAVITFIEYPTTEATPSGGSSGGSSGGTSSNKAALAAKPSSASKDAKKTSTRTRPNTISQLK